MKLIDFSNSNHELIRSTKFTKPMMVQNGDLTIFGGNSFDFIEKSIVFGEPQLLEIVHLQKILVLGMKVEYIERGSMRMIFFFGQGQLE